jgi:putative ABC transport system permease protein
VLAVSVGLTLIMITVNGAFADRLDEIKGEVGSDIVVTPAGTFGGGFFRGGIGGGPPDAVFLGDENSNADAADDTDDGEDTLTGLVETDMDQLASIDNVVGISRTLTEQYTGEGLQSAIRPDGNEVPIPGFTFPIFVTGTNDPNSLTSLGVTDPEFVAGRTFNVDEADANVAVIGDSLAEGNDLTVGSTFELNGESVEVVGIFTTGTQFGGNAVFLPLQTAQTLFDREGEVDQATVVAQSVDDAEQVASDIRAMLGEDVVDVATQVSAFDAISGPISDAKNSSQIGMIAALVASAAVILFSVGLVVRQRVKEIGILKSIGASNWHVIGQFGVETIVASVVAAVLGALVTFPLAQTVANGLVSDPAGAGGVGGGFRGGGPGNQSGAVGGGDFVFTGGGGAGGLLGDVDVAVSPEIFVFALVIALGLAVVATVVPAWYASRVRPAEVLRYE